MLLTRRQARMKVFREKLLNGDFDNIPLKEAILKFSTSMNMSPSAATHYLDIVRTEGWVELDVENKIIPMDRTKMDTLSGKKLE